MAVTWAVVLTTGGAGQEPDDALIDQAVARLASFGLSQNAQDTLQGMRNKAAQMQSIAARLALVWALSGDGGVHPFDQFPPQGEDKPLDGLGYDEQGAPCLPKGKQAISLAHCAGGAVAVCTDEGRIGVDIEPCERRVSCAADMAKRYFSPAEYREWQRQGGEDAHLLRIWTRKEALGKAMGEGLRHMSALDTLSCKNACFDDIPMDGFVVSICQLK